MRTGRAGGCSPTSTLRRGLAKHVAGDARLTTRRCLSSTERFRRFTWGWTLSIRGAVAAGHASAASLFDTVERQLAERIEFDCCFAGCRAVDRREGFRRFDFSKNRDASSRRRSLRGSWLRCSPCGGEGAIERGAFLGDGTLLKAWASMKSFRSKTARASRVSGRNGEADFRKTKRSNETHASTTDADARLFRKADGQESRLCYLGHALMENRSGLVVAAEATLATGTAEREAAARLSERLPRARRWAPTRTTTRSLRRRAEGGQDRAARGDQRDSQQERQGRKTAVSPDVATSLGYAISQRLRKRIEESFGWSKTVGGLGQVKVRGLTKVRASSSSRWPPTTSSACSSSWTRGANCARKHEKRGKRVATSGQDLHNPPPPGAKNRACLTSCANALTFSAACSAALGASLESYERLKVLQHETDGGERRNASALSVRFSKFLARRRQRLS